MHLLKSFLLTRIEFGSTREYQRITWAFIFLLVRQCFIFRLSRFIVTNLFSYLSNLVVSENLINTFITTGSDSPNVCGSLSLCFLLHFAEMENRHCSTSYKANIHFNAIYQRAGCHTFYIVSNVCGAKISNSNYLRNPRNIMPSSILSDSGSHALKSLIRCGTIPWFSSKTKLIFYAPQRTCRQNFFFLEGCTRHRGNSKINIFFTNGLCLSFFSGCGHQCVCLNYINILHAFTKFRCATFIL